MGSQISSLPQGFQSGRQDDAIHLINICGVPNSGIYLQLILTVSQVLGSLPITKAKRKERTRNSEPDFDKILILISNVRFMNISVIIPTYNEQDNIEKLIAFLQNVKDHEQIIEIKRVLA